MFCALHNYTYTVKPIYNLTCTGGERICCNGQGVGIHSACKQKHRNAKKAEKSTSDTTVKQITQVSDYTGVKLDRFYLSYSMHAFFPGKWKKNEPWGCGS